MKRRVVRRDQLWRRDGPGVKCLRHAYEALGSVYSKPSWLIIVIIILLI